MDYGFSANYHNKAVFKITMSQDKNKKSGWVKRFDEIIKSYKDFEDKGWLTKGQISETVNWDEIKSFISSELKREREEIIKNLVTIRDVELSDTSMIKSRAAYNINLLIDELQKK